MSALKWESIAVCFAIYVAHGLATDKVPPQTELILLRQSAQDLKLKVEHRRAQSSFNQGHAKVT